MLQHRNNPVDWYPWGELAFAKAVQSDRPIFLSVGYAACHWCHVMEHESFENEQIAAFLNEHFVSIKVDREERPDIDQIYMNAVQVMTGRGGWPMSVFLDHQRKPFYAGTYWPPDRKFGMPGFAQVLDAIADAWRNRRDEVEQHAVQITEALEKLAAGAAGAADEVPAEQIIDAATDRLVSVLDAQYGGFGGAPKFPHATDLDLLLRRGHTRQQQALIDAAELTLDRMAAGGIRDHIGGGFARYSVDAKWLVPHFEKMLYDNALLAEIYLRGFQVTGHRRHADVAVEILDYLCRDMLDEGGGFHCSEDADSEGEEGKFYVWTPDEVRDLLGPQRGDRFCRIYDITETGNFEGKSIPNLLQSVERWAVEFHLDPAQLRAELAEDRERLFQGRRARVAPGRDDKVLVAWNALAIRALAVAGGVLGESRYVDAAVRAADFILKQMSTPDGRLHHAYRRGQAHLDGFVDDYAFTAEALVALFESTGEARWIAEATRLAEILLARFEDPDGAFFYVADDSESLITRNKDWHDGSLVSGNASAAMALLKLSRLTGRDDFREAARRVFQVGSEVLSGQSAACGGLLSALDRYWNDSQQLVLAVGDRQELEQCRAEVLRVYRPGTTYSWVVGDPEHQAAIDLNRGRTRLEDQFTLYVCRDFTCERPLAGEAARQRLQQAL